MRDPERFHVGDTWTMDGVDFRVRDGTKFEGDLVLEWKAPAGWRPVTCDPLFLAVDFIAWNEDARYPHPAKGGQMILDYLRTARIEGWRRGIVKLHEARARYDDRLEYGRHA